MRGMGQPPYIHLTANENVMHGEKRRHLQQLQRASLFRELTKTIFNVQIVALSKHVTNYGSFSGFLYLSPTTPIKTAHTICHLETYCAAFALYA